MFDFLVCWEESALHLHVQTNVPIEANLFEISLAQKTHSNPIILEFIIWYFCFWIQATTLTK